MSTEDTKLNYGMVAYVDGSSKPNPGYIGWGFHGYKYNDETPKKGTGNPTHFPTIKGYELKVDKSKKQEITPIKYFDGFGCRRETGSNNLAELLAANTVINLASDNPPTKLHLRTDSEYVRKGIDNWNRIWNTEDRYKVDIKSIPNGAIWLDTISKLDQLQRSGTQFSIEWIKGHSGILGNDIADKLANIGSFNSLDGNSKIEVTYKNPEGYWKHEINRHPFISMKSMFFNTLKESHIPGEYYLGDLGNDIDVFGSKMSDGAFAVIQLKEPDPVIEYVRTRQSELCNDEDSLVMLRLDELFRPTTYDYIKEYGKAAITLNNQRRADLRSINDEPLTRVLKPPKIAMRVIDSLSILKAILLNYKDNLLVGYRKIDITDHFYNKETKKVKKDIVIKSVLKPTLVVGTPSLELMIKVDDKDAKIILTLGIDIPTRNHLKSLESSNAKLTMLVWNVSDTAYKYVTVIESNDDIGVWAGFYSNVFFIK
jgi:ribonuclease HI